MKRILLVLPSATYRTHAFMSAAVRCNVEIIVASDHRQALASLVPDTTIALNFRKPPAAVEKIKQLAARKPLDAVIGVDDDSSYLAAVLAEALSLPHNPVEAVEATRNKYLMRQKISRAGLNSPGFQLLRVDRQPSELASTVHYPAVLKPIFLSASRGVTRVNNPGEFTRAFQDILRLFADAEVIARAYRNEADFILAEDYIPGMEIALEGILIEQEIKTLAIFDKPDPLEGPHFVETIYTTPSQLPAYVLREATHAAHQAALAIGLENGPIHAEIRINENGAWVVEIAARSIGGLCSRALRFDQGMSLEELILRRALGEDVRAIQRERLAAGVMMIPIPQKGILEDLQGIEAAKCLPGIEDIIITIPYQQAVTPMPRGGRYLGFIFARGELPDEVEKVIRQAYRHLDIRISPDK